MYNIILIISFLVAIVALIIACIAFVKHYPEYFENQEEKRLFFSSELFIEVLPNTRYVLLGESTHGTDEFYLIRESITEHLIQNNGFNCILLEIEWSIGRLFNKFVQNTESYESAGEFLIKTCVKFPKWMWRNIHIKNLLEFVREFNRNSAQKVSIYGVDCQDLELAKKEFNTSCNNQSTFECNIVKKIIENHSQMVQTNYWNRRDTTWYEIIEKLLDQHKCDKFILWAHNSHIGNASCYEDNVDVSHINIGYLLRKALQKMKEKYSVLTIGFVTGTGTVRAANSWGGEGQIMTINDPLKNSYEEFFKEIFKDKNINIYKCDKSRNLHKLFRYIGVIYDKNNEKKSHYKYTNIDCEFDYIIYIHKTKALDLLN